MVVPSLSLMLSAVKFNYKPSLEAEKIDDVPADGNLSPKLVASQLAVPEETPQNSSCVSGLFA